MNKNTRFVGTANGYFAPMMLKQELLNELSQVKAGLTKKALFTIFVIIVFVFALTLSVL